VARRPVEDALIERALRAKYADESHRAQLQVVIGRASRRASIARERERDDTRVRAGASALVSHEVTHAVRFRNSRLEDNPGGKATVDRECS
jgi:hypothetical protein